MKCPCCKQELKTTPIGYWRSQDGSLTKISEMGSSHMRNIAKRYVDEIPEYVLRQIVKAIAARRGADEITKGYDPNDDVPF